ncbi:MAG: PH domain-containing protein [Thalassotalea sp.]
MDNQHSLEKVSITEQQTDKWQRISPIAMLYFVVKLFWGIAGNIVYLAPAVLLGYKKVLENPHIWLPIAALVILLILLSTFLSFYFFQYRLSNGHIEIRSGVISKKHINLPFTRIQNVKLEQPLYYRPFHYTCMQLDTAGSHKQEAKVVALKLDFAEALKREILAAHQKNSALDADSSTVNNEQLTNNISNSQTSTTPIDENETLLNTRSLTDLVIHGLTNNRIWIFLGGLAPFFDNIGRSVVDFFQSIGIDIEQLFVIADKSWWQIGLYALTLTFIAMLFISLFSVAGAILSYYNFTLSKLGDRYIRRSGLFTKHEVTMRLSRLQMIVRQQDWLDVLLKRMNVKFEQISANGQQYGQGAASNKIIVPSVKAHEFQLLINDVYPENQLNKVNYQSISPRFLLRHIGYFLTPIFITVLALLTYHNQYPLIGGAVAIYSVISLLVYCRWKRWGYAVDEHFIYIRKGMLGVDYYCFPIYKVQQTQFVQSWFLKRHQLCAVNFILAAGSQKVPFIVEQEGLGLINNALYQVESSKRSWM